jgi:hypothetical protein
MSDIFKKKQLQAELDFLKKLFNENLPVGDNIDKINEYFNSLEELIYTKDGNLEREEFPPDDPTVCGQREYRYYSTDLTQKLASGRNDPAIGQDMGHSESKQAELHAEQDYTTEPQDLEHIQEHSYFGGCCNAHADNNHLSGQLDSGNSSKLSDDQIEGDGSSGQYYRLF